jgi:hypothetical protein
MRIGSVGMFAKEPKSQCALPNSYAHRRALINGEEAIKHIEECRAYE